ncbi:MAG: ABC transporter ATP-binding protein [Bryobacter sp.]|nr:ABC transporter ATP-binding protein [Bryobacter sp. CoA8 C33]
MISVQNVAKRYRTAPGAWVGRGPLADEAANDYWALRDISFDIAAGEVFGLVGPNGAGKSTLLQILAGILEPTHGRVLVRGRVSALLELGAGFNLEFTGRENVRLSAELHGLSRSQIDQAIPPIEAFAEIGRFFDRPVREYSTGMYVRLAFASAIYQHPETLIVDEALAVGDARFANKCIRRLEELKASGTTILFVSHDLGIVKRLCDRAALLWEGRLLRIGSPSEIAIDYSQRVQSTLPHPTLAPAAPYSSVRLLSASLSLPGGSPQTSFQSTDTIVLTATVSLSSPGLPWQFGLLIRNRQGIEVAGTNTSIEAVELPSQPSSLQLTFTFPCRLTRGDYTLTLATQSLNGAPFDWRDDWLEFTITDRRDLAGTLRLDGTFEWKLL